jgi:hypothetical protein
MMAENRISLREAAIIQTAQSVAGLLEQAAQPGPVPAATGASPIDAAAATVAATVAAHVASSSAELAPRGPEGLAKAQAAVAEMKTADETNAGEIKSVPETMQGSDAARGGVQAVSTPGDPDFDWNDFRDGSEPLPLGPQGAAPGPSVVPGTGVPASLVSYTSSEPFDWNDFRDGSEPLPLGPQGAAPGPSVIPGTGVPDSLI